MTDARSDAYFIIFYSHFYCKRFCLIGLKENPLCTAETQMNLSII